MIVPERPTLTTISSTVVSARSGENFAATAHRLQRGQGLPRLGVLSRDQRRPQHPVTASGKRNEPARAAVGQPQRHSGRKGSPGRRRQQVRPQQAPAVPGRKRARSLTRARRTGGQRREELCVHASTVRPDPFVLL